jgi:hypothetical protein
MSHRAWNRLQHALHGNGAPGFVEDDADYLDEGVEDDMLELDVEVEGFFRTVPLQVLWRADDGSAAVALPA